MPQVQTPLQSGAQALRKLPSVDSESIERDELSTSKEGGEGMSRTYTDGRGKTYAVRPIPSGHLICCQSGHGPWKAWGHLRADPKETQAILDEQAVRRGWEADDADGADEGNCSP